MNAKFSLLVSMMLLCVSATPVLAQQVPPAPSHSVKLDEKGVMRWSDSNDEVALFGVNYCLPSACDYRAAGYVHADRKKLIDVDLAHLARMGMDGLRLSFWGDFENSDADGNLIANDHLDLMDYLVFRAHERGLSILLSPIVAHSSQWPDLMREKAGGFAERFEKSVLGTDPKAIAAQANYLRQLMRHVNPYTGVAIKDEPAIQFIELINEPWQHSKDVEGSVAYINALADAVRESNCDKLLFFNLSQDWAMARPINLSQVHGYTFGWYPTALVGGHTRKGNFLRSVDRYDEMRSEDLANHPRVVYEFDAADTMTPYLYPAMARTFRSGGVQFAAMFSYDMLDTAPYNLGWQTHYFNLVYTPKKAMSAVIACEAMRRLPRFETYGTYPANTHFGDFRVSYEDDLAELVTRDTYLNAGETNTAAPDAAQLKQVAGCGSSPVVKYAGTGCYFFDKISGGLWRLEVYPDSVPLSDPFEPMSVDKVVTRIIERERPMTIALPDLGAAFVVRPVAPAKSPAVNAQDGTFAARPGVYLLSKSGPIDLSVLPKTVGRVGLDEFHAPSPQDVPRSVELLGPATETVAGEPIHVRVRVADRTDPDKVTLWLRRLGERQFRAHEMKLARAYEYECSVAGKDLKEGRYEYCVGVASGAGVETFPGRSKSQPGDWNFNDTSLWTISALPATIPLRLLEPERDFKSVSITRAGGPTSTLTLGSSPRTSALRISRLVKGKWAPEDSTAALYVGDRIRLRAGHMDKAVGIRVRGRANAPDVPLIVTLVEQDGTSWSATLRLGERWGDIELRLKDFKPARGVMLPQAFPNLSEYWIEPAEGRGQESDSPRLETVENLQFSIRTDSAGKPPTDVVIDIEDLEMTFE